MPSVKPRVLIRTEQDVIDRLDRVAKEKHRSRSNLIECILIDYLESYERLGDKGVKHLFSGRI